MRNVGVISIDTKDGSLFSLIGSMIDSEGWSFRPEDETLWRNVVASGGLKIKFNHKPIAIKRVTWIVTFYGR